jgi:homoserine O-acetyltransferase/O-succinyltransferase
MNAAYAQDAGRKEANFIVRDFRFQNGETLSELRLHYVTLGTPKRDSAGRVTNAVLLLHGTNGNGKTILDNLASQLFGSGQPLDSAKYYLIIPDALGCGGSSKPSDGLGGKFPRYGYNDMVEAQKLLVTEGLGIDHLRLIVGLSMGAMNAWIWGEKYPDMMDALMPLVSLPGPITGHNLLWRRMITESIRNDPDYNGGNYVNQPSHWRFTAACQYMITESRVRIYEAAPSRAETIALFDKIIDDAGRLDANDYLYGYEASWDYDPEPDLGKIKARLLAVNFADDMANALELESVERAVAKIPSARSVIVPASQKSHGHFGSRYPELWKHYLVELIESLS